MIERPTLVAALVLVLALVACSGEEHCEGGDIADPGVGRPADAVGLVRAKTARELGVAGRTFRLDDVTDVAGNCSAPRRSACYAAVVARDGDLVVDKLLYLQPHEEEQGIAVVDSSTYAVDEDTLTISPGIELPLAASFEVSDCDGCEPEHLMDAPFGAAFYVDVDRAEVVRAGLIGCM